MGKKNKTSLGKALIRNKNSSEGTVHSSKHTTMIHDNSNKPDLKSVTEETALNEFISTAELANREFTAEKLNTTTIVTASHIPGILTDKELNEVLEYQESNKEFLNIPRRPFWDSNTTPEQLETSERDSFLHWRRQLAQLDEKDEKIVLTPYEKNIDVWKQLWRVIERSDVVCQIVDARNPLLFKCNDLEKYVKEVDESKENIILINKADYLSEQQRKYWSDYFSDLNLSVVFWSALLASSVEKEQEIEAMDTKLASHTKSDSSGIIDESDDHEDEGMGEASQDSTEVRNQIDEESMAVDASEEQSMSQHASGGSEDSLKHNKKYSILSKAELIEYFERFKKLDSSKETKTMIGMVGFPNVGKSSTINALLGDKKTSVSSTPGKTKHFQTIHINEKICLCDCPGLVFPTFVSTKAAMILNGILPVDQLRDYRPPATLLCKLMPRDILERTYGINIVRPGEAEDPGRPPTADEFLSAYSSMRGFMTAHGLPDCSRGARHVIKDFLSGKLLYCEPPPTVAIDEFQPVRSANLKSQNRKPGTRQESGSSMSEIDKEFFKKADVGAHYNTPFGMRSLVAEGQANEAGLKPWKKHFNRNKKEKLRRINR